MIGWYVHHQGRGHLHRALAVSRELTEPVTVLSSLPAPEGFDGDWVRLARDDDGPEATDPTAAGRLHWAPAGDPGLRRRMHQVSRWLDEAQPRLLVVDVSVEVTVLARLHGTPVVSVVLPGRRVDAAHQLGFDVADRLVAVWPPSMTTRLLPDSPVPVTDRVAAVGGLARFPVATLVRRRPGPRRAVLLSGGGGSSLTAEAVDHAVRSTPGWEWQVLGPLGAWHDDPRGAIETADVVVTHAGQNALAEVAAARRPAIVVPQPRPHDEQSVTAAALRVGDWPAVVRETFPERGWSALLDEAAALDGMRWSAWCDGGAARRFADLLAAEDAGTRVA